MNAPTNLGAQSLKRLTRFLVGKRKVVWHYHWQDVERSDVYSDTDWAGCPKTRKSTSVGCVMVGTHFIKAWSSSQASISLSSGEAEVVGVTEACAIAFGYRSLPSDLGLRLSCKVWTDSSAAIGICKRQGLGKLRHLDTQMLWVQQRVRNNDLDFYYVPGEKNPADVFMKPKIPQAKMDSLLWNMGCRYTDGRPESAPELRKDEAPTHSCRPRCTEFRHVTAESFCCSVACRTVYPFQVVGVCVVSFRTWEERCLAPGGTTTQTTCRLTSWIFKFADKVFPEDVERLEELESWLEAPLPHIWDGDQWRLSQDLILQQEEQPELQDPIEVDGARLGSAGNGREFINWRV